MSASYPPCSLGCGRGSRKTSPICGCCASGLSYWRKKRPAERLARRDKLHLLERRLEEIIESNVVPITRKRRGA